MANELASVVVPVFNGSRFLRQCIDSVLAQTYDPLEIIAVNDGSTDDSLSLLGSYGSRLRIISQSNSGVAAARNRGISEARGAYVGFLDQDDWWLPEKLERQVAVMRFDHQIGLVHTDAAYFDDLLSEFVEPLNPSAEPVKMVGRCWESLLLGNPITNSSVVVRRYLLDEVGSLDTQIRGNTVQDYDLWLRLAERTRFGYVPEKLTVFRIHSAQGHRERRKMLGDELAVLLRHRTQDAWLRHPQGRPRLQRLYDELATAHFDAGESVEARRYFAKALTCGPSARALFRFAASCLPPAVARRLRQGWQSARNRLSAHARAAS